MGDIVYVSALYDIYGKSEVSDILVRNVAHLVKKRMKLVIYVDTFYAGILRDMEKAETVRVEEVPLNEWHVYKAVVESRKMIRLPERRNTTKDTYEYMGLMNTKIECLKRAAETEEAEYIAWIDAGISKLFKDKESSLNKLERLKLKNVHTGLFPGCYRKPIAFDQLCKEVYWIYLGTFFICKRSFVPQFYALSFQSIAKFFRQRYITWEVNVWIDIYNINPNLLHWYAADHNDLLTEIPPQYIA